MGAPGGLCALVHGLQEGATAETSLLSSPERAAWPAGMVSLANARGLLDACADDTGAVLRCLSHFRALRPAFSDAEAVVCLQARPAKSVLAPLDRVPSLAEAMLIELAAAVREWGQFDIRLVDLYIGYLRGLAAGQARWEGAMRKFEEQVGAIGVASPPVDARYRSRALPVLGYLAQLSCPPPHAAEIERRAVQQLWHLLGNAVSQHAHVERSRAGGCRAPSRAAALGAAAVRAALSARPSWTGGVAVLRRIASHRASLVVFARGQAPSSHWDTDPCVEVLREAVAGLPRDGSVGTAAGAQETADWRGG